MPKEQISTFLGHLPKDSDATTSIYAPYDPEFCSEAVDAIQDVMKEVRKHLKRANIDQPMMDVAALAKSIPSKVKRGVGDAKREEIRFLILSGLPHKEVVLRAKVSSGAVSLIRQENTRGYAALSQLRIDRLRATCVSRWWKFEFE